MAYVTPNSTIEIFKNIPWDNTYEHTLYFTGNNEHPASYFQDNLFRALRETANLQQKYQVRRYEAYSYQRKSRNSIKINVRPDEIYDYNYMRFKNTSHGNKWFYAFINDVEYVNENTALIVYEIDVLQTYLDEMVLKESYVERKHTATDVIGENLEPEPVEFGEYKIIESRTPWDFNDYEVIAFFATADVQHVDNPPIMYAEVVEIDEGVDLLTGDGYMIIYLDFYDADAYKDNDIVWGKDKEGTISEGITYSFQSGKIGYGSASLVITNVNGRDYNFNFPANTIGIGMGSYTYGTAVYGNAQFNPESLNIGSVITFNKVVS